MNPHDDKEYWRNLSWPAAPNQEDYDIFKKNCHGTVLLLGSTYLLLTLCDEAWDLQPKYADNRIKNIDWCTLDQHWDTIMIDGGLTFSKEFTNKLLPIVLKNCDTFIARSFLAPNWPTKYATYFPKVHDLSPSPIELPINEVYTFYIWTKSNLQS